MKKYHYTECGLDNVYLLNGFKISKTKHGDEVFIHDIHDLHQTIAGMLISKPSRLSGDEIRFIRHYLDLSQTTFAKILGVTYQSVLGWEKGKTPIQKPSEHLLRALAFSYINTSSNKSVYDKINEIADLDAEAATKEQMLFKEVSDEWRMVA